MDYPANTLSPLDLQAKALTELNETEDCRRQGLAFLRDAIAEPKYDGLFAYHEARRDLFLLAFLRWRKFDCRRALRSLVRFSRFRTAHPAFFTGNVHNLALFMDHGMIRILPKRTPQGCAIAVCDWALFNRDRFTYEDEMRAVVQLALSLISSVQTQVAGVVLIENLHGFRMPPMAEVLKTMELVQGCLPLRLHRVHIVFPPWYMPILSSIILRMTTKKIRDRILVHQHGLEGLRMEIPDALLPHELGGSNDDPDWRKSMVIRLRNEDQ